MRLIKSIGCNKKANLQQNCNEFWIDNAKSSISVHDRKKAEPLIMPDNAEQYMET